MNGENNVYDVEVTETPDGPVSRVVREYVYDKESKTLWITSYDEDGHATSKTHEYHATDPRPGILAGGRE